jgi:hypothetical protein
VRDNIPETTWEMCIVQIRHNIIICEEMASECLPYVHTAPMHTAQARSLLEFCIGVRGVTQGMQTRPEESDNLWVSAATLC